MAYANDLRLKFICCVEGFQVKSDNSTCAISDLDLEKMVRAGGTK